MADGPSATPQPLPNHTFDEVALADFLADKLPGFDQPFEVDKFAGGQSNPTYRIETAAGSYVLRKKPAGNLLPSAHAIEREFAVMAALQGRIPLPRMHLFCDEDSVIGQPFYLMEFIAGRAIPDAPMTLAQPDERRALWLELVSVLAGLHQIDFRAVGLTSFGKAEGYVKRQLARWSRQYAASRVEDNADMDQVIAWLEANQPARDETAIVHGDYRNHNVIFAPGAPHVAAVLDWELATIGHPLADLAYTCLPYYLPPDDVRGFMGQDPSALGIPTEEEVTAAYCRAVGRSDLPDWRFFVVFSLFRSAAIRAGVLKRAIDGNASDAGAFKTGQAYRSTAACAWRLAQSAF